jgi:uncharacterized membrane protein
MLDDWTDISDGKKVNIQILLILKHCFVVDIASTICIFILSAYINYFIGNYSYAIILMGGFLAYMRYSSIVCYRKGEYCPFPFNF